jgi:hypothetical protein
MAATINGKRRPPPKPSASPRLLLPWFLFKLEPELLLLLCLHFASTRAQATLAPLPPPRFLVAAVNSSPPVRDWLRRSPFLFPGFARGSPNLCYRRFSSPAPVGAAPRPHRSAANPLPSLTLAPATSSTPASLSSLSLSGEQKPPPNFPSSCILWRIRELDGAAAPPPSGAGRRRGMITPLDPSVTCTCAPSA